MYFNPLFFFFDQTAIANLPLTIAKCYFKCFVHINSIIDLMMEMFVDIIVSATIAMIFVFLKITTLCKIMQ